MENSLDQWVAQSYKAGCAALREWVGTLDVDTATRDKVGFCVEQWIAAANPSNYLATNPAAIQRAVETRGESLADGMRLYAADVMRGRVANTDENAFEVGTNLATTPGAVVLRNELIELIQYAPMTARVGKRPLLIVPPCINKFYILDLGPESSFVRHCLEHGHSVFMLSWRNPGIEQSGLGWEDYLRLGVVEAIAAVRDIARSDTINALGFCVGGTILSTALAALAAAGERPVASLTLLATLLDFSDVGQLGIFIDPASVALREATLGKGGLLQGAELAGAFSALRPTDLLWNYVNKGYLQGHAPQAFDLLYWNADSTNLPGPMYCWYLRNMYLENRLRRPGALICLGQPVSLARLDMPSYVLATREDHIVPWRSAFEANRLLSGEVRFVLGASGHIAGIVNPPQRKRRSYWTEAKAKAGARAHTVDAGSWLERTVEHPGSWWNDWADWQQAHSGASVAAPRQPGNSRYRPLVPAPGEYVKVRV